MVAKRVQISARITEDLNLRFTDVANRMGLTKNALLILAMEEMTKSPLTAATVKERR